ncbi:unnamed protein product, partial [Pylaiella littoralis]
LVEGGAPQTRYRPRTRNVFSDYFNGRSARQGQHPCAHGCTRPPSSVRPSRVTPCILRFSRFTFSAQKVESKLITH